MVRTKCAAACRLLFCTSCSSRPEGKGVRTNGGLFVRTKIAVDLDEGKHREQVSALSVPAILVRTGVFVRTENDVFVKIWEFNEGYSRPFALIRGLGYINTLKA